MRTATLSSIDTMHRLGILSTLADAALEFMRGRPRSGLVLLGSAAISARIPGFGVGMSVILRIYRRLFQ